PKQISSISLILQIASQHLQNKPGNFTLMTNKKFIKRKDFIVQSTSLLTASMLAMRGFTTDPASKYKMGLQLFTVRGPLANDLEGTVKKIASIGYEDSETYGYDPDKGTYYGIKA